MFFDKLPQSLWIGLRPDETAAKAGVALGINRCAMCQSESEEASVARPEDQAWEAAQASRDLKSSFHELRSSASEAPCRRGRHGLRSPSTFPARVELVVDLLLAGWTGPHRCMRVRLTISAARRETECRRLVTRSDMQHCHLSLCSPSKAARMRSSERVSVPVAKPGAGYARQMVSSFLKRRKLTMMLGTDDG